MIKHIMHIHCITTLCNICNLHVTGIGKAMVEALHKIGANVYAISKNPDNLKALKEEFPNIQTVAVDLGNWKDTRAAVEGLPAADYLINNAGVCVQETFSTTSEADLDL